MISVRNKATNQKVANDDFTIEQYQQLLALAQNNYKFASYSAIPWGERFILWRHDVDYSLNRALVLAKLEHKEGVKSTYFINPHSEFYNLAEVTQHRIVQQILSLGYELGLHFDAEFYTIYSEKELSQFIKKEADYLFCLFGVKPIAFSFHNPVEANLVCEAEKYGGLVNCYSRRLRTEVSYCSDSNGYWRFHRLHNVLTEAKDPCLQVLTHPSWWQDKSMPPRQRIFRSVYGRAVALMKNYDATLEKHHCLNHMGDAVALLVFKSIHPEQFQLWEYL